jgi:plasmid stability protein
MPQVLVRNIDPGTLDRLKERARRHGRSLQAELRLILVRAAESDPDRFWNAAQRVRESVVPGGYTDSTELVREDRER